MESSTVLAFRIFVMLSCLIIVPMAAIFGSAFPDVVKTVLVDRIVALGSGKPAETTPAATSTEGFREVSPGPAMAGGTSSQAPSWNAVAVDQTAVEAPGSLQQHAFVAAGGANTPHEFSRPASFSSPGATPTSYPAPEPTAPSQSPYHRNPAAVDAAPPSERVACPLEPPERFTEMERKLREHGATYYLLETWGKNGDLYRFHCRMAVGNNPNYTRHFEASNRDALKAMSEVLERVEAWRAGRLQ